MLHVSSKECLVEIGVKGKRSISCIVRKLYMSCTRSLGILGCITEYIDGNFLINRGSIIPRIHEQGWSDRGKEVVKYRTKLAYIRVR